MSQNSRRKWGKRAALHLAGEQHTENARMETPCSQSKAHLHMCADSFMVCYESRKISENPGDKGCKERKGGKRPMTE